MIHNTGSKSIVATTNAKAVSKAEAKAIGEKLKVDFDEVDLEQFRKGLEVEQEHKDVTGGDPIKTAKIALAHLRERADYYTKLEEVEGD